jgi:hypothetical protein
MDALGGVAALRDGPDGQVLAAVNAVAAGPDAPDRGSAFLVDSYAAAFERDLKVGEGSKHWPMAFST